MFLKPLDGEDIFLIHDVLSPEECVELIARSESIGYEAADVGGESIPQLRNNGRALLEDPALASELWKRVSTLVPLQREGWSACGLHERFRFYRYETSERFGAHYDGSVHRGEAEESKLTFMIYLSDVAEGGATNFYGPGGVLQFEVRPTPGTALIFDHCRLHEGAPVIRGRKYVLRTDVMYSPPEQYA